ncbi:imm11 family protein [Hyalangium gracile]|uniref:imm11 family protein n=1 Tax=Hyalangium gracile TaxID=394092 RepID=UPI001CCA486E|nr:DUF1629 domain-containing protein [Hyalangium gracile]
MNYFVLKTNAPDGGLIEMYPPKSPTEWRFDEGESLIREFPKGAAVQFSDNFPDNRKLYDFQTNTLSAFIISERTRKLLESLEITNAEYLPVDIKDHKGQVVGKDYSFLNLLGGEEAIDMEKSVYKMNSMEKEQVGRIKKLAINEKGIRPGMKMFRCSKQRRLVLIREDVLEEFKKAGLSGFKVYKAEGWNGLEL